jgi:exodeoxyribonuclease VIII
MLNLQDADSLVGAGLIANLDIEAYHSGPGVSKSLLDKIDQSPAHYLYAKAAPKKDPTPAQRIGTLAHTAILEPHKLKTVVGPDLNKNAKEWKAFVAEAKASGLEVVSKDEQELLEGMARSIQCHPSASWLIGTPGKVENSAYWTDPSTGLLCRCRPDKLLVTEKGLVLVDLKTTEDASEAEFSKSIENFRYHVQAAFYSDGIETVLREHVSAFVFLAVEKKAPYAVACYQLADIDIEDGREAYQANLFQLEECLRKNEWPGYSTRIETITRPSWAKRRK